MPIDDWKDGKFHYQIMNMKLYIGKEANIQTQMPSHVLIQPQILHTTPH